MSHNLHLKTTTLLAASSIALGLSTVTCGAATVSMTRSVSVEYTKGSTIVIDETIAGPTVLVDPSATGPAPDAKYLYEQTSVADMLNLDDLPSGPGLLEARILDNSYSYVSIAAQLNDSTTPEPHTLRAEVEQTFTGGNPFSTDIDLSYSFDLKDMFIEVWDRYGAPLDANPFDGPSEAIGGEIYYRVQRDNVTLFEAVFDIWGGATGFDYDLWHGVDGISTSGNLIPSSTGIQTIVGGSAGPVSVPRGMHFIDWSVTDLMLGRVSPMDTFEVKTTMGAALRLPAFSLGAGGRVNIGDPNALSGTSIGRLELQPVGAAVIPLPAGVWLLLSGMLGLLALGRFRQRV